MTNLLKTVEKNMQNVKSVLFYDEFLGIQEKKQSSKLYANKRVGTLNF